MATDTQTSISELKQVSSKCKILKDVGDFLYIVEAFFEGRQYSIKFQIEGEKYTQPLFYVRGPSKEVTSQVQHKLGEQKRDGMTLADVYNMARCLLKERDVLEVAVQSDTGAVKPKGSSPKAKHATKVEKEGGKKPPMRTAADVVKRVKWDDKLDEELIIVGYLDRFLGIQEQPFAAFNWVNPAAADWWDLNIPEHRIEYFKYDDKIVWEKKTRTDNVFGSTGGSTIYQMIGVTADETAEGAAEPIPMEVVTQDNITGSTDDSSEDENDLDIQLGEINVANPIADTLAVEKPDKPDHFIAFMVDDPIITEKISTIQKQNLFDMDPSSVIDAHNLHVTLCALRIDNDEQLDMVSQAMFDMAAEFQSENQKMIVGNLDTFWNRVLYTQVELDEKVTEAVLKLRKTLLEAGIRIYDEQTFVPHITLAKYSKRVPVTTNLSQVVHMVNSKQSIIGEQKIVNFTLLSMMRDENDHYITKSHLLFSE